MRCIPYLAWLAGFGEAPALICLEATGAYRVPLAEYLVEHGFNVSVVNPAKIASFAKSELSRVKPVLSLSKERTKPTPNSSLATPS